MRTKPELSAILATQVPESIVNNDFVRQGLTLRPCGGLRYNYVAPPVTAFLQRRRLIAHTKTSLMGGCVSAKYIVLTKVQLDGDKVRLRTTVFVITDRHEWQHRRKKTVPLKDWEERSHRFHQEMIQTVIEVQ
jgi:hypothetical protein